MMKLSPLPWRLAQTVILVNVLYSAGAQGSSVNVALQASFNRGPFLVELLETAASENSTCYFPLLDSIARGTFADSATDKELYDKFIEVLQRDGHLKSPEALSSFQFALSLHAAAPRIEAQFQYYNSSVQPHLGVAQDAVCPVWVHFDGQQYCSPSLERAQQPVSVDEYDELLPFDRVLGPGDAPASILYADLTHPLFAQFHSTISQTAKDGKTSYRVRYRPSEKSSGPLALSGYGVELSLKRTDYIVIDDREDSKTKDSNQEVLKEPAADDDLEIKPLTTSELYNLGMNAASWIATSSDPFESLQKVTSNFPKYSSFLASQAASAEFISEHIANRERLLPSGFSALWVNGLQIENRRINAYDLLDHLRRERKLIDQMRTIGLSPSQAVDILANDGVAEAQTESGSQRFDWRDDQESNNVIIWMNDLEKDKRYEGWPTSLTALFQRMYPGQLPSLARDIHNIIFPINMANVKDLQLVVTTLQGLVKREVPVRIGLVPTGKGDVADVYAKLSYHIVETYGLSALLAFYQDIIKAQTVTPNAEKHFVTTVSDRKPRGSRPVMAFADVVVSTNLTERLAKRTTYIDRLELHGSTPPFIVNGAVLPWNDNWFEQMSARLFMDLQTIQQAVYEEAVPHDTWIPELFLNQAVPRRNGLVVPSDPKDIKIVDVATLATEYEDVFASMPRIAGANAPLLGDRAHLLVVADLHSKGGRRLLLSALEFQSANAEVEVLVIHNPGPGLGSTVRNAKILRLLPRGERNLSTDQISKLKDELTLSMTDEYDEQEEVAADADSDQYWASAQPLVKELDMLPSQNAVWLNGRFLGPLPQALTSVDLKLLLDFERNSRLAPVTTAITKLGLEEKFNNALDLAKISSVVARSQKSELPEGLRESAPLLRLDRYKLWNDKYTAIRVQRSQDPAIQLVAIIDPVSELAQSWVPILRILSELEGVNLKVFLNPRSQLSELPVKRFYRQVLRSAPGFDDKGSLIPSGASFNKLPVDTLFNLGMIVPPSWLVAPKSSIYDLDNIKFSVAGTDEHVEATYELEHILVEGHARDISATPPPRGVQLLLGTEEQAHFTDTIIMANLGYFQFKANPGYWQISLKPGRSSKIYNLDSVGPSGFAAKPGDETTSVALLSFQGVTLFPRLSRRKGMEQEDVLEVSAVPGSALDYLNKGASFASSALSSFGFKVSSSTNADINIFSVASGHLYERMLNIMMVSVMRHTTHTVKFWFIEQFLSPSFKATLPTLAAHYNFDYEMVTYKWPHWLRNQKEKQREIWGYKILFLDVLFPLNLDKVIFVDADQIVRTDMMELNKVDLHGAPYGFTPMCDSRTEMEGFRFWKQGYWETYLRGKPYHISALYVVDLKKFRELAAGDRLRQQYQALSADPASLSNLDQDLPNHMQHNLPIHSLTQEWLWCETWCSDESLTNAKTIDLCNNPLTKEPKLERARRQVPEWTEYDDEIKEIIRKAKGDQDLESQGEEVVAGVGVPESEQKSSRKDEL